MTTPRPPEAAEASATPPTDGWADFYGPNAGYVLELYERYTQDPAAVDPEARALFERWRPPPLVLGSADAGLALERREGTARRGELPASLPRPLEAVEVMDLVAAAGRQAAGIREYGHRAALLDPLGRAPPGDAELDPATHGLRAT